MSRPKFDLETLLEAIKGILIANLNTKLTEIDAEKAPIDAKPLTLDQVDDAAYFIQGLNGETVNFDPFMLILVDEMGVIAEPGLVAQVPEIKVVLAFADENQDLEIYKRLFRYSRALEEVLEEHYSEINSGLTLTISSLRPDYLKLANSSHYHRAVGVTIKAEMP